MPGLTWFSGAVARNSCVKESSCCGIRCSSYCNRDSSNGKPGTCDRPDMLDSKDTRGRTGRTGTTGMYDNWGRLDMKDR